MKGTVYGIRLPRGTQVEKKGREPLKHSIKRQSMGFVTPASHIRCHLNSLPTHGALAGLGVTNCRLAIQHCKHSGTECA